MQKAGLLLVRTLVLRTAGLRASLERSLRTALRATGLLTGLIHLLKCLVESL